jgi:alkanesulfonate monooxygenase SsuD/methylene tetrahydromethanopterin reductase-like flavin-dependent oxidoreductase (luciferase family)
MRLAVNIPNFGPFEDPHTVVDVARRAEAAGWDGLFVWDHLVFEDGNEVADPWVLLTAAAMATERLSLAPMVTPLPRRRPWIVARQAVSLDRLSGGRLILGVGIGEPADLDFEIWGENPDRKVRAAQLDEGLEVLTGLWSGEPFRFSGEHYEVGPVTFLPRPVQEPRIPIWVAGVWPYKRPFRRAARFDGVVPLVAADGVFPAPLTPDRVRLILEYVRAYRATDEPFDLLAGGPLPDDPAAAADRLVELEEAGATWWQRGWDPWSGEEAAEFVRAVDAGPPT